MTRTAPNQMKQNSTALSLSSAYPMGDNSAGGRFCNSQIVNPSTCSLEYVLSEFQRYLQSHDFVEYCARVGIEGAKFEWKVPSVTVTDRFRSLLWSKKKKNQCDQRLVEKDSGQEDDYYLFEKVNLGIVFHGTPKTNISNILEKGLAPALRRRQACGPGEYFSKNPILSVPYCRKAGNQLMVFCVCVSTSPEWNAQAAEMDRWNAFAETEQRTVNGAHIIPLKKLPAPPRHASLRRALLLDHLVVEENSFQLPLGTLEFQNQGTTNQSRNSLLAQTLQIFAKESHNEKDGLRDETDSRVQQFQENFHHTKGELNKEIDNKEDGSREMELQIQQLQELQMQQLQKEAQVKEERAKESQLMTKIIQWIICGETETASHVFQKATTKFSDQSKREIAYFAYKRMDEEFVAYYFKGLPTKKEALNWGSFENQIVSVETCQGNAKRARSKVEEHLVNKVSGSGDQNKSKQDDSITATSKRLKVEEE